MRRTLWIRFREWSKVQREDTLRRMEAKLSGGAERLRRRTERVRVRKSRRLRREAAIVAALCLLAGLDGARGRDSVIRDLADRVESWETGWTDAADRFPGLAALRSSGPAGQGVVLGGEPQAPPSLGEGTNGLWE